MNNEPKNPTSVCQKPVPAKPVDWKLPSRILLQEEREIVQLHQQGYGTRQIARRVCHDRKTVRRVLLQEGLLHPISTPPPPNKLDPFRELIRQKVDKNLTLTRILREIRVLTAQQRGVPASPASSHNPHLAPASEILERVRRRDAKYVSV